METPLNSNQILLTRTGTNSWMVQWGDITNDKLTWDEMLGQVASLTLNGRSYFPIHSNFPANDQAF